MKEFDLREFVSKLNIFYGLEKTVSSRRLELWLDDVTNIPKESLDFIYKKIIQGKDTIPRNLPKYIKQYFLEWRFANPDKQINPDAQKTPCEDCFGKGILWFKKKSVDGFKYELAARCGHCRNWIRHVGNSRDLPLRIREDLINQGYEVYPYDGREVPF